MDKSSSNLEDLDSSFLSMVESPLHYLHKAVLNHPFYEPLINGTLKESKFAFFLGQQECTWYHFSKELLFLSKLNYPKCINTIFAQSAHFALMKAGDFSILLGTLKLRTDQAFIASHEYIDFLSILAAKRLFLPLLTVILPRFWLTSQFGARCLNLNTYGHLYKKFIEHCISQNAEDQTLRIIRLLDALIQTISEAEKAEILQLFMDAALHECELLNEANKHGNSS